MTSGDLGPNLFRSADGPMLNLIEVFGPMSGMHAAMDRLGLGMPCGLIARFQGKTGLRVEDAITTARRRFPILECRVAWVDNCPMLAAAEPIYRRQNLTAENSSLFKSDFNASLWHYRLVEEEEDAWLVAIWLHAVADGPSMLRFLETIGAAIANRAPPKIQYRPGRPARRQAMAPWLARFLIEQHLRYIRPSEEKYSPGIAWVTVPPERSTKLLERARTECGSVAALLASAACTAICDQQGKPRGRVLLNLLTQRDNLECVGGFGFGAGSLLMPVKWNPSLTLSSLARRIVQRVKAMSQKGWNENFERFLGSNPRRHLRFASFRSRGLSAPIVSVSWKGVHWQLGVQDSIRNVACFAVSSVVHISGHIDRNGLSLSVTSTQSKTGREDLLRRVLNQLEQDTSGRVFAFDGLHFGNGFEC